MQDKYLKVAINIVRIHILQLVNDYCYNDFYLREYNDFLEGEGHAVDWRRQKLLIKVVRPKFEILRCDNGVCINMLFGICLESCA